MNFFVALPYHKVTQYPRACTRLSLRESWHSAPQGPVTERGAHTTGDFYMADEWHDPLLSRARELRRSMTPQERKLWYCFLKNYPVKIYKQKIIGPFIVDFYCHAAKLVIELDGPVHHNGAASARDDERTALLTSWGLKILHIENVEIDFRFQAACKMIQEEIQKRL